MSRDLEELQYFACKFIAWRDCQYEIEEEFHRLLCDGVWCEALMDFIDGPIQGSLEEALGVALDFLGLNNPKSSEQAQWLMMNYHCSRILQKTVTLHEGVNDITNDFPSWDCEGNALVCRLARDLYILQDWYEACPGCYSVKQLERELERIDAEIWELVSSWDRIWSSKWKTLGFDIESDREFKT